MALSPTNRFLREAYRIAGPADYFRWADVARALGYSDDKSIRALQSLDQRKLLIVLVEGNARLLRAGRELAARLDAGE
jgi:Mn-dependent DtxR family transcriptional regulator